jgi:hypothetical protein
LREQLFKFREQLFKFREHFSGNIFSSYKSSFQVVRIAFNLISVSVKAQWILILYTEIIYESVVTATKTQRHKKYTPNFCGFCVLVFLWRKFICCELIYYCITFIFAVAEIWKCP